MGFSEIAKVAMNEVPKEVQTQSKEIVKDIDKRVDAKTLTDFLTKKNDQFKINDIDDRIDFNTLKDKMNDVKIGNQQDIDSRMNAGVKSEKNIDESTNKKDIDIESRVLKDKNGKEILDENGNKQYVDNNGKIFRRGNKLEKNCVYEVNGYTYHTDEKGRVISASGNVKIKNHVGERNRKNTLSEIGEGSEKDGDHRGHIIGDQLGGSNGKENLVPQSDKLNQGDYKKLENQLKKEVENGNKVDIKVELKYNKDSYRPDKYIVTYHINGEKHKKVFSNGG